MNLPEFLKEVDHLASKMTNNDLEAFLHEIARILPEEGRNRFLHTLKAFGNSLERTVNTAKNDGCEMLRADIEKIQEKLLEINKGKRSLDSEYNEEWDDWYNSDVDQILFSDPQGVLEDINRAIELLHRCVDMEVYKEGCELAEIISFLEVSAEGDYEDFDGSPLGMDMLCSYELLKYDFKKIVQDALYLTYLGNALEDRADELFCIIGNLQCYDIKLEDIMQIGNHELPEFDEFLLIWIDYLGLQNGKCTEKLLMDAQSLVKDDDVLLENSRKLVDQHPTLFEQLLRMKLDSGENDKMFKIGMEALDKIPDELVIRSKIALLTAEYASRLNADVTSETCWVEAFRSDSSAVNYLRIRFLTQDWTQYENNVRAIYEQVYRKTKELNKRRFYGKDGEKENCLYFNEYLVMLFFDHQFDKVFKTGLNEKKAVGWSETFMKQGLAFFLLLLYDGEELPVGLKVMMGGASSACAFNSGAFFEGTNKNVAENNETLFWQLFSQWKRQVQIYTDERKEWLASIDKIIAQRVQGIMEGNHRNYYGECASFIAALGEVQESVGIRNAKSGIMERYRSEYSRRSAFHKELKVYGMKK